MPETPSHDWSHVSQDGFFTVPRDDSVSSHHSALRNKGYSKKKPTLEEADFELTKWAAEYKSWGAQQIEDRQNKLAKLAVSTWPLKINS